MFAAEYRIVAPRDLRLVSLLFVSVGLAVVLATFRDYGITWDEPVQSHYGEGVLRYFASGLQDRSIDDFLHMRFYGPLFELSAAVVYAGAPDAKYEIRHLLIALTGLLAVWGVIRIAALLPGRYAPVLAPLSLVALPRFYGHAFNNSKDVPFACAFVWAIYATCRFAGAAREERAGGWLRGALGCGLALGLALAVRPGGLPLLLLLFFSVTALGWLAGDEPRKPAGPALAGRIGITWGIAWIAMVALWPFAHANPIGHPIQAVLAALSFPDTFPVLFEGEITRSDALPHYYLAKYLAITTPPSLLLAGLGLVAGVRDGLRSPRSPASLAVAAVVLWLLAPLALASVSRPNVYDGMRHLLFALPALALLAGHGGSWVLEGVEVVAARSRLPASRLRHATLAGLALVISSSFVWHVRLHPYQSTYFNGFVGGMSGANGRYETDYWLASYREAMQWVNARAQAEDRDVTVLVAADPYSNDCAATYVGPRVTMVRTVGQGLGGELPEPFDYYVGTTRYGLAKNFPDSPVAHRVGREGATFTVIRSRRPASERSLAGR